MCNNRIPIDELPIEVTAFEDENGYALVLTSKDARIGDSHGKLVKNFLVRIARGDVPREGKHHVVMIDNEKNQTIQVESVKMDETGRLFAKSATDKVQRPVVQ